MKSEPGDRRDATAFPARSGRRQFQRSRRIAKFLLPEIQLLFQRGALHPLAFPKGEISVLHRQFRDAGAGLSAANAS